MRSGSGGRGRKYAPALALLCAGPALGLWHNYLTGQGRADPVIIAARTIIGPAAAGCGHASAWVRRQFRWMSRSSAVFDDNRRLRARVTQLESADVALAEAQADLERLRAGLGFIRSTGHRLLAADVIALGPDPMFDTLIIGRGSSAGIRRAATVVCPSGLVGRVLDVQPSTASVLLLPDPNSGVGIRVQRSRVTGVCQGDGSALLNLRYLPGGADVRVGDMIVTSGLGGVFPAGIEVGTVLDVRADPDSYLKTARVRPGVDFDRLEEVYVFE